MKLKMYALFEPGGRQVRGFSYGKLVEVRYIDVVRTDTESANREKFIEMLRDTQNEMEPSMFRQCRIGHVDENDVGQYFDPLEFLQNNGNMREHSEPRSDSQSAG